MAPRSGFLMQREDRFRNGGHLYPGPVQSILVRFPYGPAAHAPMREGTPG